MRIRLILLVAFLIGITAIRWWIASQYELAPDESYYYLWAQHPDICYYSKGPGVAMAILASTFLFGPTEFGVRFFSPLLGLGTSLFIYLLARALYREKVAFWATFALNLVPIFNVGSIVMTIDPLSIFFWSAALYTFWLALEPRVLLCWPVTGTLIGLGFLCKYTNALQLLSILLLLLLVPKYRTEFKKAGLYLLLICFLAFLLPPVIWNQQHEWITLAHLSARGGLQSGFGLRLNEFAEFVGGLFSAYSPLVFLGFLIALFGSIPKAFKSRKVCYLLAFCWPTLLIYAVLALHESGNPNWTAPAFVSLGILAVNWWAKSLQSRPISRRAVLAALLLSCALTTVTLNTDLLRIIGIPLTYRLDPSARLRGWKTVTEQIENLRAEFEKKLGAKVFLIGNKYQTAAMLSFYLKDKRIEGPGHPPVYIPESQDIENEFSFWPRYDEFVEAPPSARRDTAFTEEAGVNPFMERTALYVTDHPEATPPQALRSAFTRWEPIALYQLKRRNLPLREIRVFACYQYQTLPL